MCMDQTHERRGTCNKCHAVYVGDDLYTFCPVCGEPLEVKKLPLKPLGGARQRDCPGVPQMIDLQTPYSIKEVSALMGLSARVVTQLFERERGVIIYEAPNKRRMRAGYRTIRIPRPVYERVMRRLSDR